MINLACPIGDGNDDSILIRGDVILGDHLIIDAERIGIVGVVPCGNGLFLCRVARAWGITLATEHAIASTVYVLRSVFRV